MKRTRVSPDGNSTASLLSPPGSNSTEQWEPTLRTLGCMRFSPLACTHTHESVSAPGAHKHWVPGITAFSFYLTVLSASSFSPAWFQLSLSLSKIICRSILPLLRRAGVVTRLTIQFRVIPRRPSPEKRLSLAGSPVPLLPITWRASTLGHRSNLPSSTRGSPTSSPAALTPSPRPSTIPSSPTTTPSLPSPPSSPRHPPRPTSWAARSCPTRNRPLSAPITRFRWPTRPQEAGGLSGSLGPRSGARRPS